MYTYVYYMYMCFCSSYTWYVLCKKKIFASSLSTFLKANVALLEYLCTLEFIGVGFDCLSGFDQGPA